MNFVASAHSGPISFRHGDPLLERVGLQAAGPQKGHTVRDDEVGSGHQFAQTCAFHDLAHDVDVGVHHPATFAA